MQVGIKPFRKIAVRYDRTALRTLIQTGLRTGTNAGTTGTVKALEETHRELDSHFSLGLHVADLFRPALLNV